MRGAVAGAFPVSADLNKRLSGEIADRVEVFKAQQNIQCGVELPQTGGAERSDVVCQRYFGEADQFVAVDT